MAIKQLKSEQLAYAAGLIDGEGCLTISVRRPEGRRKAVHHCVRLSIGMTHLPVLRRLRSWFGGQISPVKKQKTFHKQAHEWRLWSNQALDCIEQLLPYLVVKRAEARVFLQYKKWRRRRGAKDLPKEIVQARESLRFELMRLKRVA